MTNNNTRVIIWDDTEGIAGWFTPAKCEVFAIPDKGNNDYKVFHTIWKTVEGRWIYQFQDELPVFATGKFILDLLLSAETTECTKIAEKHFGPMPEEAGPTLSRFHANYTDLFQEFPKRNLFGKSL